MFKISHTFLLVLLLSLIGGCGSESDLSKPGDTTPDPFLFDLNSSVELNTLQSSNPIRVSGIDTPATITISAGEYAINGAAFTDTSGTLNNNDEIVVRHTSASTYSSSVVTTIFIGGISAKFESQTMDSLDSIAPLAEITFPKGNFWTTNKNIILSGFARDESGISAIIVDGVSATTSNTQQAQSNLDKQLVVEWEADVSLDVKTIKNDLVVKTADIVGNVNSKAAVSVLLGVQIPYLFDIDNQGQRLIGCVENERSGEHRLQVTDLADRSQSFLLDASIGNSCASIHYAPENDTVLVTHESDTHLFAYSLYSTVDNALVDHGLVDVELPQMTQLRSIEYSWSDSTIYFGTSTQTKLDDPDVFPKTNVFKHIIHDNLTSLLSGENKGAGPALFTGDLAISANFLVADSDDGDLIAVDLETGDRTLLSIFREHRGRREFIRDPDDPDRLLIAFIEGSSVEFASVSLNDATSNVVFDTINVNKPFSSPASVDIDFKNNTLLMGFQGQYELGRNIVSVNLLSGHSQTFLLEGVGQGVALDNAHSFALTSDGDFAYVLDNYRNQIIKVNLTMGTRTLVLTYSPLIFARDILLDEDDRSLLLQGSNNLHVYSLKEDTLSLISDNTLGDGPALGHVSDAIFDRKGNRVIVLDDDFHRVLSIDTRTGERTLLSSVDVGEGPSLPSSDMIFPGIDGLVFNQQKNEVYFGSPVTGDLFKVELETGNRSIIAADCRVEEMESALYREKDKRYS